MSRKPIYRIGVTAADNHVQVGEFDDLAEAIDFFTQVLETHIADVEKGVAIVSMTAE